MLLNQAGTETLIAQNSSMGSWQLLPYECPINPVHAALFHTGVVFIIAGSGNDPDNVEDPAGSAVWKESQGKFDRPTTPLAADGLPLDIFCVGHSFLSDGRLICNGGTLQYSPFFGLPASLVFDPTTEEWTDVKSMSHGRWYPTVITLGDGRVLAVSGLDENGLLETYQSIYSDATSDWTYFTQPTSELPMYAHLFQLSSGKIFFSGACFKKTDVLPRILTVPTDHTQPIREMPVGGLQKADYVEQAASVLLPPAQDQKVMIVGGGNDIEGEATNRVNIVDFKSSSPTYKPAAPLNSARMHHNAVLLPDRTVFVCNGSTKGEDESGATLIPEIYNPATNTWTLAAKASVVRLYHALALLLPDGRVFTAGSNPDNPEGGTFEEKRLEIYSPPYMSQKRPVIQSAPQTVKYGGTITITTGNARNIKWVSLIKPMATTHGLDTEQRLVDLAIDSRTSTSLTVTVTRNPNLAPAGWYMLFINDRNSVPSVAKWIHLT